MAFRRNGNKKIAQKDDRSINTFSLFTCHRDDDITYIGEIRRQLLRRAIEHTTGKDQESAVFDHIYQCDHCQSVKNVSDCFEVLQSCQATS